MSGELECGATLSRATTNENTNGLLRQYLPKDGDLSRLSQRQLDAIARRLNTRPRKTLGYRTPAAILERDLAPTGQIHGAARLFAPTRLGLDDRLRRGLLAREAHRDLERVFGFMPWRSSSSSVALSTVHPPPLLLRVDIRTSVALTS